MSPLPIVQFGSPDLHQQRGTPPPSLVYDDQELEKSESGSPRRNQRNRRNFAASSTGQSTHFCG